MKKIRELLQGWKSYIIAAGTFVIGGLIYSGIDIPLWVYPVLASLGLGAISAKINRGVK